MALKMRGFFARGLRVIIRALLTVACCKRRHCQLE